MLFNILCLVLLIILNSILGKTIYYESVLSYKCKTDKNCADLVSNSMCLNNKCVCQLGYKPDGIFRCTYELRYRRQNHFENLGARMLGEECQANDECRRTPVDGTKICLSNQCQCSSGYVPIDAYRCIRDFEQLSPDIQVTKSTEIEEFPGYGSKCSTNNDCQHSTVQLECLRETCVCLEGYVPLGKYLCYNIRGQGAPIIESSTSTSTLSTTTTTTTTTSNLPNNETVKSLSKLGTTCTNDYYCRQSIPQSHCYNGQCSCIDGYISLDLDTCIENKKEDLTTISTNYKSLLGGQCITNQNCRTLDARCLNYICTCLNGYFAIDDWNCLKDSDSSNHETTTKIPPSTTVFLWWPWSSSTTTRQSLINSNATFHSRCLLNGECMNMDSNSHCTLSGRCVCNIGYKLDMTNKEQKCVRQIIDEEDCD